MLQKELPEQGIVLSKNKMMELLSEIRECWVKDNNSNKVTKVLEEMDDMQINMWKVVSNL